MSLTENVFDARILFDQPVFSCDATVVGSIDFPEHHDNHPCSHCLFIVDQTPFHPLNQRWPDQPGDRGWLLMDMNRYPIRESLTVGIDRETRQVWIGDQIQHKRDDKSVFLCTGHVVQSSHLPEVGRSISLELDIEYRTSLSVTHTACHLMSLALNETSACYWRKSASALDARGRPDLDRLSIQSSKIKSHFSVDRFRFGKSLRKMGFQCSEFADNLSAVQQSVNQQVKNWIQHGGKIQMAAESRQLGERRTWKCHLDEQLVEIPCGGTHAQSLEELGDVELSFEYSDDAKTLEIHTRIL